MLVEMLLSAIYSPMILKAILELLFEGLVLLSQ